MTLQVWSAADVSVNFGGIEIDEDQIGPDDFVTVEQLAPDFKLRKGIGGGATRSQMKHPAKKVTVKVRQCGSVNSDLSAVLNLDRTVPGGAGIVPFAIKDRNGNFVLADLEAFIEGDPNWKAAAEESDVEWVIYCASPDQFTGGH
jgi:hypothetical protein